MIRSHFLFKPIHFFANRETRPPYSGHFAPKPWHGVPQRSPWYGRLGTFQRKKGLKDTFAMGQPHRVAPDSFCYPNTILTNSAVLSATFGLWVSALMYALPMIAPLAYWQAVAKVSWFEIPNPIRRLFFNCMSLMRLK